MLREYASQCQTVEIHDTFFGIPPEPLIQRWHDSVPAAFVFSPKIPQQITHEQRFAHPNPLLDRFLKRCELFGDTLGPLLLVAPVGFTPSKERLALLKSFISALPSGFRWALELRHRDWFSDETLDFLSSKQIAVVVGENRWVRRSLMSEIALKPTAGFSYVRWSWQPERRFDINGDVAQDDTTAIWSRLIERMSSLVGTVFGYFSMGYGGNGLRSAQVFERAVSRLPLDLPVAVTGEQADPADGGSR